MNFSYLLKKNSLKITNSRLEILELIEKLDTDATNKKILEQSQIDKSTVYRIIELLLKKNILEKNLNYNDDIYYSIIEDHTHYIKCIKCHKKEKIDICPIPNLEKKGYKIINHKIEINGICYNCLTNSEKSIL